LGLRTVLREPLLHFVAIGAALFLWFEWGGGAAGPGATRIAITAGQIDHLAASYAKAWQRPPSDAELKGLIDDWVREEIAVREAVAAGLDRDDTIIRRRLRQKFEFLAEDAAQDAAPTDEELQAWLDAHADAFWVEPRVAFSQIFLSRERRGASAEADAGAMLARLNAASAPVSVDALGDATMLPQEVELALERDVDRLFGPGFAKRIEALAPGAWAGPVTSSYGLHLVRVRERVEGSLPALAAVRPLVEREVLAERRKRQLDDVYVQLLAKYRVVVEPRPAATAASGAAGVGQ
jgi:PPIC-type PPIASE domain